MNMIATFKLYKPRENHHSQLNNHQSSKFLNHRIQKFIHIIIPHHELRDSTEQFTQNKAQSMEEVKQNSEIELGFIPFCGENL